MKGFKDPQGKFRPTENKSGLRKSRDQKLKEQGIKIKSGMRKGRWDNEDKRQDKRYMVSMSGVWIKEKDLRPPIETNSLGEAIRAVDEGRGNTILDLETGNIIKSELK